jgi:glycosyltransferase involved in cell wall biosynthesis
VAICIAAYRRPQGLTRLLEGIGRQILNPPMPEVRIFVVDNDPEGSAARPCEAMGPLVPWPITYVHERDAGVSHARNCAVACAQGWADYIAFLDDDEVPTPRWLEELLRTQRAFDADIVTGPVLSDFEVPIPKWLAQEPYFTRPRYPTGTRLGVARTGNVLIRAAVLPGERPFDHRFNLSGGEDTLLFLKLAEAGHAIVWADEAEVWESVPASRATIGWVLRRAFQVGNCWSLCELEMRRSPLARGVRLAKGLTRMLQGLLLLPGVLVLGRRAGLKALRYMSTGAGNTTGALGVRFRRYQPSNGRPGKAGAVGH